jgi:hypothetical protein
VEKGYRFILRTTFDCIVSMMHSKSGSVIENSGW